MVLSHMKEASGRRSVQSKSSNVLKNLSLPQEERILRSAYRGQNAYADLNTSQLWHSAAKRNMGHSMNISGQQSVTDPARAYDMMPPIGLSNKYGGHSASVSPDLNDSMDKSIKARARFEFVCSRKEEMIANKQQHVKEMLNKKFKREKENKERMDQER